MAVDKAALARILSANTPGLKAFEPGKANKDDVERAFKALKKNFDLEKFAGRKL